MVFLLVVGHLVADHLAAVVSEVVTLVVVASEAAALVVVASADLGPITINVKADLEEEDRLEDDMVVLEVLAFGEMKAPTLMPVIWVVSIRNVTNGSIHFPLNVGSFDSTVKVKLC